MDAKTWVPEGISQDSPNGARMYDYFLGGYYNFEIDRLMGDKALEIYPDGQLAAQACRAFLRRIVNFLVAQGIDQFLEIGSGIPTAGHVHEVAQRTNPAARVVYVDIDAVAVAHGQAILKDNPNVLAIEGDVRRPDYILGHPEVGQLLDFGRPMAVSLLTLLHFVADEEQAYQAVRMLRDALVPGSYIAISHGTRDNAPPETIEQMEMLLRGTSVASRYRSHAEIGRFFEGLEVVEPGLVHIPLWRPEGPDDVLLDEPERVLVYGGVGRKP
jgi:SAM-dependent methyltransferase